MIVKLLTQHHLEFLSLKGGCTGSSESTHVKMPHCWKSHVKAHITNTQKWHILLKERVPVTFFILKSQKNLYADDYQGSSKIIEGKKIMVKLLNFFNKVL